MTKRKYLAVKWQYHTIHNSLRILNAWITDSPSDEDGSEYVYVGKNKRDGRYLFIELFTCIPADAPVSDFLDCKQRVFSRVRTILEELSVMLDSVQCGLKNATITDGINLDGNNIKVEWTSQNESLVLKVR